MRRPISLAEISRLRATPGATVALFLTDRCPVGCSHCSVMSRPDGPSIADWDLFAEVIAGIASLDGVGVVAVTGGEPFAERRGLKLAVSELTRAGKELVLFTSGYWAAHGVPGWVFSLLASSSTTFLSTDSFHAKALRRNNALASLLSPVLLRAADAIIEAGSHLVFQVFEEPGLVESIGERYPTAEISVIRPLSVGLGARVFDAAAPVRNSVEFGRCGLLASPTVRYDGIVSACCNEAVIMGAGPAGLRRRIGRSTDFATALRDLRSHPVSRLMARHGPAAFADMLDLGGHATICGPCWAAHEAVSAGGATAGRILALGMLP